MDEASSGSSRAAPASSGRRENPRSPVAYREKPLDYEPAQICFCKAKAPRLISWSDLNPGRRYYKCGANTGPGCTFWKWADPEIPPFLNQLIRDLRDNVRELKNENANLKMQASKEEEKEQVIEEDDAMKLVRKMDTEMAAMAARIDKECKYKKMFYVLAIIFVVWLVVLESVSLKYIFE